MANVLLGVTGSVAAVRAPALFQELKKVGHLVKVVATQASLYFFDPALLDPADLARPRSEKGSDPLNLRGQTPFPGRNPEVVVLDEDEWPGRSEGRQYQRDDPVLHIELRRWADLFLVAPLDANTLAKLANGLADNCLTCVWRAWDAARPVLLAPAMNTLMWEHPLTVRHLGQIARDAGAGPGPEREQLEEVVARINRSCPRLHVVPPQNKRLACGDVGVGAMAEVDEIVRAVQELLP